MTKGVSWVIGSGTYRSWDPSGGANLPQAAKAAAATAGALADLGVAAKTLVDPDGAAIREAMREVARGARDGGPGLFVFHGAGATRSDGELVLCGADTDRTLAQAVPLTELAWIAAHEGPQRLGLVLDCGFGGIAHAEQRVRTLTPHAQPSRCRLPWRTSDLVIAWSPGAAVDDGAALVASETWGAVLYQIHGGVGGDFMDIDGPAGRPLGQLMLFPAGDPTVPPPFEDERDYWYWRPAVNDWPDRFVLRASTGPAAGPPELAAWQGFRYSPFPSASQLVAAAQRQRCYRIVRHPDGAEVGYLELHGTPTWVDRQTWYAAPGQLDLNGFYLLGPGDELHFSVVAGETLTGTSMHVLEAPRISPP